MAKALNNLLNKETKPNLIIIQQSWCHFCAFILHAWIFGDNLPNTVKLISNHSKSQPTITTYHLPLTSVLLFEDFMLLESSFTTSWPPLNLLSVKWCYIRIISETFEVLQSEFSPNGHNFFMLICSPVLMPEQH